jgi:hypothetical protein
LRLRSPGARMRTRASSTATSSRRTSCLPSQEIDVRLLDFGLAQMAEFDTLTGLGDAARVHLPGTAAWTHRDERGGRLGSRRPALGGARHSPVLGRRHSRTSRGSSRGTAARVRRPDLPKHVLETVASALS